MNDASVSTGRSTLEFHADADLATVSDARRAVESWLAFHHPDDELLAMTVPLVASELATNAVVHGGSGFVLTVADSSAGVVIRVTDDGPGIPAALSVAPSAAHGRGLALVAAVAVAWGWTPLPGRGKIVWALVPTA